MTAGDRAAVAAAGADVPVRWVTADVFEHGLAAGHYRPAWTWLALDGSRVVARAVWWGRGAAPLAPEVQRDFEAVTGGRVVEGYGLTETNAVGCSNFWSNYAEKPDSTGRAQPFVEVAIMDDDRRPVPTGERGEIAALTARVGAQVQRRRCEPGRRIEKGNHTARVMWTVDTGVRRAD